MAILRAANDLWLIILLLVFVAALVIFLPVIDRSVCRKLRVNLIHNLSENPNASRILVYRKMVLFLIFLLYMAANLYLVFFSRTSVNDYSVHVAPLQDLANAIHIDGGISDFFTDILTLGLPEAVSRVDVVKPEDVSQAVMNILFYVPMGYLLPYVFDWFRKNKRRTVFFCVLFSFFTENIQLIFRRGCYDFDDLVFNSIGGLLGVMLYRSLAYYITHPNWRRDRRRDKRFGRLSRKAALTRFASDIDCARVSLYASHEEDIYDFYVTKLGFRLRGFDVPPDSEKVFMLLRIGGMRVEFICANNDEPVPQQSFMMSCSNLDRLSKRLRKKGIEVSKYTEDIYTKHKSMYITGPDNVKIIFGEY